jgi:hypothetical protein
MGVLTCESPERLSPLTLYRKYNCGHPVCPESLYDDFSVLNKILSVIPLNKT